MIHCLQSSIPLSCVHLISWRPLPSRPSLLSRVASSTSPAGYCIPTSSLLPIVGQQWQARPQPQGLKPGSFGESPVWVVSWGRRDVLACERRTLWWQPVGVGSLRGQEKTGHTQIKIQCLSACVSRLALVPVENVGSGHSPHFQGDFVALHWSQGGQR